MPHARHRPGRTNPGRIARIGLQTVAKTKAAVYAMVRVGPSGGPDWLAGTKGSASSPDLW
jgi:hypothetical protein